MAPALNQNCHSTYSSYSARTKFYIQEHFLIVKIFKKSSQLKPQDRSKCPIVYIVAGQAGSTTTLLQYYSSSLKHFSSTSQEKAPLKTGKRNIREKRKRKENKEKEGGGLNSAASTLLASSLLPSRPPQTAGLWPLRGSTPMQCNVVRNLQMKVAGQKQKWRNQLLRT